MDDLKIWLDNPSRDYFQGVALYQKYGADIRLKMRVFPSGDFLNNRKVLVYELGKILQAAERASRPVRRKSLKELLEQDEVQMEVIPAVGPIRQVPVPVTLKGFLRKEFPKIDYANLPDELKILIVERIYLFNRAGEAREKKFEATTEEERLHWNILEIKSRIENNMKKHNLPSAISKAKKAIREAPDNAEQVAKKELLLQKYELQEKEINRLLGL